MKRRITAILVLLCLMAALIPSGGQAAVSVYFTAVNHILQPLSDRTMPKLIDGLLYIPDSFFTFDELGVYSVPGVNQAYLYSGGKSLTFDTVRATVFDQDGNQYYIPAQKQNGIIYVPVYFVRRFFDQFYVEVYTSGLAPVVLFNKSPIFINESTFISMNKYLMDGYFSAYIGTPASPTPATGTPTPSPSPSVPLTYENVSVYLSFYDLTPANFVAVLSLIDGYRIPCCFFVSFDEIVADADLIRRAAGEGHQIGIRLTSGTFAEYQTASSLLFEAAKIRTVLVCSGGEAAKPAQATAAAKGLVCWNPSRTYDETATINFSDLTDQLGVYSGGRDGVSFACTDKTIYMIGSFLEYLSQKRYTVRRITEKTVPVYTVG